MLSRKIRNNLKKAPFFLIVAAIVATIWYLAWQNHNHFENAMVRQSQNQLTIIARSEAQSIEKYVGDIDEEVSGLAADPRLAGLMASGEKGEDKYLGLLKASYGEISKLADYLCLTDDKGIVMAAAPSTGLPAGADISGLPDIKAMLAGRKPFTSGLFEGISGNKEISNLHPVFSGGKLIGILRAVIFVDRINNLIGHINREDGVSAAVIDDEDNVLSSSEAKNIGMKGAGLVSRMELTMLVSRVPMKIGPENWSIAVAMDYGSITGPINRNARDNLVFVAFILIIFLASGVIFYRYEKKNAELSISKTCLDLINKQLHIEIETRKDIEKNLKECLRNGEKR